MPSVPTTVCWSVVVPFQVMANGAVSAQPAAISILPRSTGPGLGAEDHQRAVAGRDPADLGGVNDADVAAAVAGSAGCRRRRAPRWPRIRRARSRTALGLRAHRGVGRRVAEQERVAAEQPDHQLPGLGGLDQQLRDPASCASESASVASGLEQVPEPLADPRRRRRPGRPGRSAPLPGPSADSRRQVRRRRTRPSRALAHPLSGSLTSPPFR